MESQKLKESHHIKALFFKLQLKISFHIKNNGIEIKTAGYIYISSLFNEKKHLAEQNKVVNVGEHLKYGKIDYGKGGTIHVLFSPPKFQYSLTIFEHGVIGVKVILKGFEDVSRVLD